MTNSVNWDSPLQPRLRSTRPLPCLALGCLLLLPAAANAAGVYVGDSGPGDPTATGVTSISKLSLSPQQALEGEWISTTLYDGTTIFTGISFSRIQLDIPAAGILRVQLNDLAFPAAAGLLSVSLVEGGDVGAILPAPGDLDLEVSEPGRFFAYVYAVGAPGISVASYYLNITHLQAIPLPAAVWLLLSGILAVGRAAAFRRTATKT